MTHMWAHLCLEPTNQGPNPKEWVSVSVPNLKETKSSSRPEGMTSPLSTHQVVHQNQSPVVVEVGREKLKDTVLKVQRQWRVVILAQEVAMLGEVQVDGNVVHEVGVAGWSEQ